MTVTIRVGDVLDRLRGLPDASVHCAVTSPPYWGLRSYKGDPGMIGLEPTFDAHLETLVEVFREVRRVLRKDGTLWLNYGDAYAAGSVRTGDPKERSGLVGGCASWGQRDARSYAQAKGVGLKPKDLMMMPARVAMALQSDGWWLRSEIIWHKPNPMPESVTDRPTSSHEKIYLLTKSARYFYDAEAVRHGEQRHRKHGLTIREHGLYETGNPEGEEYTVGANLRNVWKISTHAYSEAHFATFPPALIEPCVKAGTSEINKSSALPVNSDFS